MQKLTTKYLQCAHRILRYVSGTKDRGLLYRKGVVIQLFGYMDVDWVGDASNFQSTSGFTFSLGSGVIAWSSKEEPTVALLSTEAGSSQPVRRYGSRDCCRICIWTLSNQFRSIVTTSTTSNWKRTSCSMLARST